MNLQDTIAWFEKIAATPIPSTNDSEWHRVYYDVKAASGWITEAQAAIESVFPPAHSRGPALEPIAPED